ncbi:MAG: four-carbon acid sugar kinase family protein [Defluviitaleaceae bacterium]|nr:four-carbon acid sugar kinase family protein [Defluviitaleaceae bacterium]
MTSRYLIIADDITGSNDTGVQLKRRGLDTVVTLDAASVGIQPVSYVLDTESRPLYGDAAFCVLSEAVSKLDMSKFDHVVKKVDSTLRGPIAHEVAAVDKAYKPELIVFMPALPDLGRTTTNGVHMLQGKPITETELAKDPIAPVREDNLQKILEKVYDEPVTHIGLEAIESGNITLNGGRVYIHSTRRQTRICAKLFRRQSLRARRYSGLARRLLSTIWQMFRHRINQRWLLSRV